MTDAERNHLAALVRRYFATILVIEEHEESIDALQAEVAEINNQLRSLDRARDNILAELEQCMWDAIAPPDKRGKKFPHRKSIRGRR